MGLGFGVGAVDQSEDIGRLNQPAVVHVVHIIWQARFVSITDQSDLPLRFPYAAVERLL